MRDILTKFEEHLFLYKQVAVTTYKAYLKDIYEFCDFLTAKNKDITKISGSDLTHYFNDLKNRRVGSATASRKAASLKVLIEYLHERHNLPDLTKFLIISNTFPLMCNSEKLYKILAYYKDKEDFNSCRLFIILSLLSSGSMGVNQLLKLKKSNIDYVNFKINYITDHPKTKKIEQSVEFFEKLKKYLKLIPYETEFLFPVKIKNNICAISRQAVWSIIKSAFADFDYEKKADKTQDAIIDQDLINLYRTKHPRP